jgi:hypothetical protein
VKKYVDSMKKLIIILVALVTLIISKIYLIDNLVFKTIRFIVTIVLCYVENIGLRFHSIS